MELEFYANGGQATLDDGTKVRVYFYPEPELRAEVLIPWDDTWEVDATMTYPATGEYSGHRLGYVNFHPRPEIEKARAVIVEGQRVAATNKAEARKRVRAAARQTVDALLDDDRWRTVTLVGVAHTRLRAATSDMMLAVRNLEDAQDEVRLMECELATVQMDDPGHRALAIELLEGWDGTAEELVETTRQTLAK